MPDVVTLGEYLAVLYPPEPISIDETASLLLAVGGAEANVAIGLSQLGHSARVIGRVGDDAFGRRIAATLQQHQIDTTYLHFDPLAPTGLYAREWLPDGARRVYYYRAGSAASRLTPQELSADAFRDAKIVHVTGITPALSGSCAAVIERAIQLAHSAGCLVSFDPNYRARLWDEATARTVLLPLMAQADMLLMGHEDARAVFGSDDAEQALQQGLALGANVVVFKQAEQGAWACSQHERVRVPAYPVERVIDPVGAGDAFNAGFLAGWLRSYGLRDALALGARCGAAVVAVRGDYADALPDALSNHPVT